MFSQILELLNTNVFKIGLEVEPADLWVKDQPIELCLNYYWTR